jgi:hypothetical protein
MLWSWVQFLLLPFFLIKYRVYTEFAWSPHGVHVEFIMDWDFLYYRWSPWSPDGPCGVHVESMWSPHGVHVNFTWLGLLQGKVHVTLYLG